MLLAISAPTPSRRDQIADPRGARSPSETLANSSAQPRSFRLADGSSVALDPGSLLEVRLGPSERRLDLLRGRGRFQVFHETRPFIVHAGGGQVVARGTIFEVGYASDRRVTVRLIEGAIDVVLPAGSNAPPPAGLSRRLTAGQSLSYEPVQRAFRPRPPGRCSPPSPPLQMWAPRRSCGTLMESPLPSSSPPPTRVGLTHPAGRCRPCPAARLGPIPDRRYGLLADRLAVLFDLRVERRPDGIVLARR